MDPEQPAAGDLRAHLPGWLWGKRAMNGRCWTTTPASDSDLWIARSLLEAGRLWQIPQYTEVGKGALVTRIADEEVTDMPGSGPMVLPGKVGFGDKPAF